MIINIGFIPFTHYSYPANHKKKIHCVLLSLNIPSKFLNSKANLRKLCSVEIDGINFSEGDLLAFLKVVNIKVYKLLRSVFQTSQ